MSKYARHETVMNGVNSEGKLQRTLVLDADLNPRHVFKLNKHYAERFERTSQFAYSGDYILETTASHDDHTFFGIRFKVYRLSGPCFVSNGRPQLYRVEAPEHIERLGQELTNGKLKPFLEFLMLDEHLNPIDKNPLEINAVLPEFLGWNGEVGITEEKQSAYIVDLLGGAPVEYIEDIATYAMYSKRQYIMPFEQQRVPESLNFHNNIVPSPGFTPRTDMEINWVVFYQNGGVEIVKDQTSAEQVSLKHVTTALKLYIEPFATETNSQFGLVVEVYTGAPLNIPQFNGIEDDEPMLV